MAKLSTKARKNLPGSAFAGPDRSYPINNPSHARNALARAAQHASPELQAKIKAKVRRKYPSIKVEGEPSKHSGDRAARHKG
jgi:hypothetical protein